MYGVIQSEHFKKLSHMIVVHREQLSTHNLEFSFASKFSGCYKYCFVPVRLHCGALCFCLPLLNW